MAKEYVINEWTKENGWCLFTLGGFDLERCKQKLAKVQSENPNTIFEIAVTNSENNWWNQGGLD